jgi:hypothetical protein
MNEEKVCFFDPIVGAYRDISVELAKKYVDELEKIKKQLKDLEK